MASTKNPNLNWDKIRQARRKADGGAINKSATQGYDTSGFNPYSNGGNDMSLSSTSVPGVNVNLGNVPLTGTDAVASQVASSPISAMMNNTWFEYAVVAGLLITAFVFIHHIGKHATA